MKCKYCDAQIEEGMTKCPVCGADLTLKETLPLSIRTRNSSEADQIALAFSAQEISFSQEEADGLYLFTVDSAQETAAKEILLQLGILEDSIEQDGTECPDADEQTECPCKKKPSLMGRVLTVFLILLLVALAVWGTDLLMLVLKQFFHIR